MLISCSGWKSGFAGLNRRSIKGIIRAIESKLNKTKRSMHRLAINKCLK
jgi:hypothetical protein